MRKLVKIEPVQRVMLDPGKDGPELGTGDNEYVTQSWWLAGKDGPDLGTGDNKAEAMEAYSKDKDGPELGTGDNATTGARAA